jgi:NtrC-family two-component system response regulator AlgB
MVSAVRGAPAARILLVDDEPNILRTFKLCLAGAGYEVVATTEPEQAEHLVQQKVFDICFLDLRIGDSSGLDLLRRLKAHAPWLRVVMVTAYSSIDSAVGAMRAGAVDYLVKPCSPEQLKNVAAKQADSRRLELKIEMLERETSTSAPSELDSNSRSMRQVLDMARQVAPTDATVLMLGESGTGKGVLARAIHRWSSRAASPFVTVSCPSLSGDLLASELFGHQKGAFTGATENRLGRVDQASGGTLFLDEIGDFPLALQPKLLRFIQEREYERVGDSTTRVADVRLVCATNRDLEVMVREGQFREDLLYRIKVVALTLPPLRERIEDLPQLANQFVTRFAASYGRPARTLSPDALQLVRSYSWPGNIRELQNVIERAVILCELEAVEPRHLAIGREAAELPAQPKVGAPLSLEELERAHIASVLAASPSLEAAARTLGIDNSTLYRKRKHFGL